MGTLTAVLFLIDKSENNPNVHSQVNGYTNCGISMERNTIQQRKGKDD